MVSCVFPGSFDPVTRGHINLISRTSALFDRVTVTVMINIHKSGAIPVEKRIELLKKACRPYPNVKIDSWDGLLADYMKQKKETKAESRRSHKARKDRRRNLLEKRRHDRG